MNNRDIKYFDLAKKAGEFSDFYRIKIGAVSVYKNKILSIGFNSNKSHPIQMEYNKFRKFNEDTNIKSLKNSLHAEIHCLLQIKDMDIDFKKVRLYIFRSCKDRAMGMVRPCKACMAMITDLGIRDIYYTTDAGYAKETLL